MSLDDFLIQPLDWRAHFVSLEGVYLATRSGCKFDFSLYYVTDFFVEVWYAKGSHEVGLIRGFTDTACLTTYLDEIDITDVQRK
ncbi:MAG: hypothetical protein M3142_07645 [Bacteroidota bacterium]|nr:hypothetical protein [Bacteroidota bacterium]